ncbi:baseplate hub subunit and tail lysozyme [Sinorhizobium phage phiM9]|uniref:Putative baseplate hub subunit and tail lysozyme n=1 Tax=Sinorhizobium phage phiM9 TaxID=1636182 RepID=A0A0F6R509_9CAUD|nr:baseplate hub subunit and tail lysozyme [Sinorhizobium phage phiM9]AKE44752.1 putative baseplate hub subunit and tail lysozyme [Sinorhizobium phage phiM9]
MKGIIPSSFGENVRWRVGVVEDRNDPQQRGRLRVRIHGVHTDDTTLIPTEALPWAIPIQSISSAALGGVGDSPTGMMEGTMVLVTFLDGNDMQIPAVLGAVGPIEGILGHNGQSTGGTVNEHGINDSYQGTPGNVVFNASEPPWFSIAKSQLGTYEFAGGQHNPEILKYLKTVGISSGDETPWCSAFTAWCMKSSGQSIQGVTGMARSWTTAGCVEKVNSPLKGCIAVFTRPPNPRSGHVAFVDSIQGGRVMCLGGNQSNKVKLSGYSLQSLIGWYWPRGFAKEQYSAVS